METSQGPSTANSNVQPDHVHPTIELPTGGGAIKGISETFSTNPVTGSAAFSIPLPFASSRGASPEISLNYDSGSGNGVFGLGWQLSTPSISRKTDKQLPQYQDAEESDIFMFTGVEDLVPVLEEHNGVWQSKAIESRTVGSDSFSIKYYRPRTEGGFQRIERWQKDNAASRDIHWRVWSRNNRLLVFGETVDSRIRDPEAPDRIYQWLLSYSQDDKGNRIDYLYKQEDLTNIDLGKTAEQHRAERQQAQRYLKAIRYGNKTPYTSGTLSESDYLFQTVFDYGEHSPDQPRTVEDQSWPKRPDPFSSYRSGFEIRTYRRCERVLLFHNFAELGPEPVLVTSLNFSYLENSGSFSLLSEIVQSGHRLNDVEGYDSDHLPPMEFDYQPHVWDSTVHYIEEDDLEHVPAGVDNQQFRWLDLYGEGLTGILATQGGRLAYKKNLGEGRFASASVLHEIPSHAAQSDSSVQFRQLEANGKIYLYVENGSVTGYYGLASDESWEPFESINQLPHTSLKDSNLRQIDLTGNGQPDLLLTDDHLLRWYPANGVAGYDQAESAPPFESKNTRGPALIFADQSESIFLADMSGDGLQDVVKVENGRIVYWPNLGYGRFGQQITMGDAPRFDVADQFDPRRIQFADLDGSGPTDLIYLGQNQFRFWLNLSGNRWSDPYTTHNLFPELNPQSTISVMDLLGTGTGCLVWSSTLPHHANRPVRYIDLMGSVKPHLMVKYTNGMGKEVDLSYTPSTKYYLDDRRNGAPWISKLHFPVHCLSQVETRDHITGYRFVSEYSYHHGFYDRAEREFRGFGRVDQTDTESIAHFSASGANNVVESSLQQPPVLTKTWFHTGAAEGWGGALDQFRHEYYSDSSYLDTPLPQPELPEDLNASEWREALRACRGLPLRQEIFGLDGATLEHHPYSISEQTCQILRVQPQANNRYAVFQRIDGESLSAQLDRNPADPRVTHHVVLEVDQYGQPLKSATISYPRRIEGPVAVRTEQFKTTISISTVNHTNDVINETVYRLRQTCENQTWELGFPQFQVGDPAWLLFTRQDLLDLFGTAAPVGYEAQLAGTGEKRLIQHSRTLYLKDDLSGPLPLGSQGTLGLSYQSQTLAFTPTLLQTIYGNRVTDAHLIESGYIHSQDQTGGNDENWWVPSGIVIYAADAADHFYLPSGSRDPFGNETTVTYDSYDLLLQSSSDALGNQTITINDYRLLKPAALHDPNENWTVVAFDTLGMVSKSAIMGKLPHGQDPFTAAMSEADTLENPSAELEYNFHNWYLNGRPNFVKTISWEEHFDTNPSRNRSQIKYEYSDGGGNVVLIKAQATPGFAKERQPDGALVEIDTTPNVRWVGNGRTILNNKGNPIKQYEPYFSSTPDYENGADLVEIGISPILFYDPVGRSVGRLLPNHSVEKTIASTWLSASWDVNDMLLTSNPAIDPVIGSYFDDIDSADYLPSWFDARIGGELGNDEQRAAEITRDNDHPNTPTVTHTDALGRTILVETDNGADSVFKSTTELDCEGNTLAAVDDRGNQVMAYAYNILPSPDEETPKPSLYQNSMDGGERWTLLDVAGKVAYVWDSRGHTVRTEYDELQRPQESWVVENQIEKLVGVTIYGEDPAAPQGSNLLGQVWQVYDQGGLSENLKFDFKGNLLQTRRTLSQDYRQTIDWQIERDEQLDGETFTTSLEFDGLNRVIRSLSPHHANQPASEIIQRFNEGGGLDQVYVSVRGSALNTYVSAIEYDAKGQRQLIEYGNGTTTNYTYDPTTYRLTRLLTERQEDGAVLQDLSYVYDPVGNITTIQDNAHQTVYFNNQVVVPNAEYVYDPLYRLTQATGREHATQAADLTHFQGWEPQAHPNSGLDLRRYTQSYSYDSVGNILQMRHSAVGGSWTRDYEYAVGNNRLLSTLVGGAAETYGYNDHGSITSMGHLSTMEWNYAEQLSRVELDRAGGTAYYIYDANGSRIRKVHEHAGSTIEERIYLGGWEIYRKRVNGTLDIERETLHVMDDQRRIALIETLTVSHRSTVSTTTSLARFQFGNHLGSAALELNGTGEIISYEEYHPYGTTAYHAGTRAVEDSPKRYRYTGKERDEETGFGYHNARFYMSVIGRWMSADPIGIGDGLNLYLYGQACPIKFIDPSGTSSGLTTLDLINPEELKKAVEEGVTGWEYFDPDDPYFMGRLAHLIIEKNFAIQAKSDESVYTDITLGRTVRQINNALQSKNGMGDFFNSEVFGYDERSVDIMDDGRRRIDIAVGENEALIYGYHPGLTLYEIKHQPSQHRGAAQVREYQESLAGHGVASYLGQEDSSRTSGEFDIGILDQQYKLNWKLAEAGVITYSWTLMDDNTDSDPVPLPVSKDKERQKPQDIPDDVPNNVTQLRPHSVRNPGEDQIAAREQYELTPLSAAFYTGLALAGAALIGGQAGPQVAAPEEVVTVPGAFSVGFFGTLFGGGMILNF